MHAYTRAYSKLSHIYIYSNGNVLPSILVPVYMLYIFCYHALLYGGNKEIYLSGMTTMAFGLGKPSPGQKPYDHACSNTLARLRSVIDNVRVFLVK